MGKALAIVQLSADIHNNKSRVMKIKFRNKTDCRGRHPYRALPISLLFVIALLVVPACNGGSREQSAAVSSTPPEAVQQEKVQPETAARSTAQAAPGNAAEAPAENPAPAPGEPKADGSAKGRGTDTGADNSARAPSYTVLDWQGGVTVKGKTPQKGQETQKEEVRFYKTSDALMVNDEKGETFFMLPAGYKDDESDGTICSGQQCDPVLMPARELNRNMKRLRDWLHIKTQIAPNAGVKTMDPAPPPTGENNPGIKRPPASIQQGQIQKENLNKKEIQKVKNIRQ